jgi:hypothetical protein
VAPSIKSEQFLRRLHFNSKGKVGTRMDTKAAKNDKEKMDLSLIPYVSQLAQAKALMVGEVKYGRYNYCKGHKASQLVAAAQRHLLAWFNGEELDPDGQHHFGKLN